MIFGVAASGFCPLFLQFYSLITTGAFITVMSTKLHLLHGHKKYSLSIKRNPFIKWLSWGCSLRSSPPGPIPSVSARGLVLKLRAYPYHHGTLIDSFQKWLDAYTTLILVVVRAYPCTAVELINICRSSAVRRPNFKGLPSSITTSSFAVPPPTSCP